MCCGNRMLDLQGRDGTGTIRPDSENAQFINNVVNSEVERNIMKEGEKPLGTLEVKCEKFHLKSGLLFPILSGGTLFIGNLLGMPFSTGKIDLELSFTIKNLNGDIIRTYDYSQTGKSALGFYYGEDVSVKTIELCRKIMDEFKRQPGSRFRKIQGKCRNKKIRCGHQYSCNIAKGGKHIRPNHSE